MGTLFKPSKNLNHIQTMYNNENKNINANQSGLSDSANEFIDQPSSNPAEMQKMFMMFQKMANDPTLFMKMMGNSMANQSQPAEEPKRHPRQFQTEQHKYRNHQVSPRANHEAVPKKDSRKRGTDVLSSYLPQQNNSSFEKDHPLEVEQLAESKFEESAANKQLPSSSTYVNPYEEIPIQSQYAVKQQQLLKESPYQIDSSRFEGNGSGIGMEPHDYNKYVEAEERPITGIKGDFKAFLQNIEGVPAGEMDNYISTNHQENHEENEPNEQQKQKKTFLKRGSRQFLSSAKDRSVGKKKPTKPINKRNDDEEEKSQERPVRSISQNRVLGHKARVNTSNNRSATKKPPTSKAEQADEGKGSRTPRNNYGSAKEPPKKNLAVETSYNQKLNESSNASPTFKSFHQKQPNIPKNPGGNKSKKKNIFNGSSSSDEQEISSGQQKFEAIPGVHLTNKQLYDILNKYSKSNIPNPGNEEKQTIKQLKNKYIDLCNVLTEEKRMFQEQMQRQKQQFEAMKNSELSKIKNERKVQERNMMATRRQKDREKEREEFQILRKELEKEKEDFKRKEKNNKIILQKYKKEVEQLKAKLEAAKNLKPQGSSSYGVTQKGEQSKKNNQQSQFSSQEQHYSSKISQNQQSGLPNYNDLKKNTKGKPRYHYHEEKEAKPEKKKKNYFGDDSESEEDSSQKKEEQNWNDHEDRSEGTPQDQEPEGHQSEKEEVVQYNHQMKLSDLTKIPLTIKMVTKDMIDNLFRHQANHQYRQYKNMISAGRSKIHTSKNAMDRKVTNIYADGGKQVIFETGVRKQYFSNGYSIIYFPNGDIKQKLSDETVLYFYKEKQVDQITLPDKTNIYRFENNQVEFHYPDGRIEIRHPDGTVKVM